MKTILTIALLSVVAYFAWKLIKGSGMGMTFDAPLATMPEPRALAASGQASQPAINRGVRPIRPLGVVSGSAVGVRGTGTAFRTIR